MGVDVKLLQKVWYDKDVENKFKCEECPFASAEMKDVKKHFLENHREKYMYKCWECEEQMNTISEFKTHYTVEQEVDKVKTKCFMKALWEDKKHGQ